MVTLFLLLALNYNPQAVLWSIDEYSELWRAAELEIEKGRPQSAVTYLNQIESRALASGDLLEQYEVAMVKSTCYSRYNWKEYNSYQPTLNTLRDTLLGNLDANIEKYARHPRVISLIAEKIVRLKNEADMSRDGEGGGDSAQYLKIREMAAKAVELFPDSRHTRRLKDIIDSMDSETLWFSTDEVLYPGSTAIFNIAARNVADARMQIFRLSDSELASYNYMLVDAAAMADVSSMVDEIEVKSFRNEYNVSEKVAVSRVFRDAGIYMVRLTSGSESASSVIHVSKVAAAMRTVAGKSEIYVADAKSGRPFNRVSLKALRHVDDKSGQGRYKMEAAASYAQDGFQPLGSHLKGLQKKTSYMIAAEAEGDIYSNVLYAYDEQSYSKSQNRESRSGEYVYTDRKLYKPGDTIQFKVIAYTSDGRQGKVLAGKKLVAELRTPSQREPVGKVQLTTNEMGSASGSFALPSDCKTGHYYINTGRGSQSLRVEEYSRPQMELTLGRVERLIAFGDTVEVPGTMIGYNGVGSADAVVEYEVVRMQAFYRSSSAVFDAFTVASGSVTTDASGRFIVKFVAARPDVTGECAARYHIKVKGIDASGETHEAGTAVHAGDRPVALSMAAEPHTMIDTVRVIDKSRMRGITFTVSNLDGVKQSMSGTYTLYDGKKAVKKGQFVSGEEVAVEWGRCSSKTYTLEYCVQWRGRKFSQTETIALFSPDDRKIPLKADLFYFPIEDSGDIEFVIGTSRKDLYLEMELFDRDERHHREKIHLQQEARRIKLPYKASYNESVVLSLFGFLDVKPIEKRHTFDRKAAESPFDVSIESLRDKTAPHQQESFVVKAPSGELTVAVFDETSDRYGRNAFWFNPFNRYYTYAPSITTNLRGNYPRPYMGSKQMMKMHTYAAAPARAAGNTLMVAEDAVEMESYSMTADLADDAMAVTAVAEADAGAPDVRGDFGETLCFIPHLKVQDGQAQVQFTAGGSLSRFRVMVLAHEKDLRSGQAEGSFVVQKDVMIVPSLPLFVTEGDEITFTAKAVNNSDRSLRGKAELKLEIDGRPTAGPAAVEVDLAPGEQKQLYWKLTVPAGKQMQVTTLLSAGKISDGEVHTVAIVPVSKHISTAAAFLAGAQKGRDYYIDQLKAKVPTDARNVQMSYEEYSAMDAVRKTLASAPSLPENDNMISWLNALYVSAMRQVLHSADAADARVVKAATRKLADLQKADGGFAWFGCMNSNDLLTELFLEKIAFLRQVGADVSQLDKAVAKAVDYVDARVMKITSAEKWSWGSISDLLGVRLLYKSAMPEKVQQAVASYALMSGKGWQEISILAKARLCSNLIAIDALCLAQGTALTPRIADIAASLKDHSVRNATVGCYFPNAVMPFRGLMHNEIYAHVQLLRLFSALGDSAMVQQIQQWLLLQKHVQDWGDNMATADAVHALVAYKAADVKFAAVYCSYDAPLYKRVEGDVLSNVEASASKISVKRSFLRDGKPLTDGAVLKVGDEVTVRYEISSEENISYVRLRAMRPANFYPKDERSFGSWRWYCEKRASYTDWYFELLPEENTVLEEIFYVTQQGVCGAGIVEIESLYAPEYRGNTLARTIASVPVGPVRS